MSARQKDPTPIYKVKFEEITDTFPRLIGINEFGIDTTYEFTGYAFICGQRTLIEYRLKDAIIKKD